MPLRGIPIKSLDDRFVNITGDTMTGDLVLDGTNFDVNATNITFASDLICESEGMIISSMRDFWMAKVTADVAPNTGMMFNGSTGDVEYNYLGTTKATINLTNGNISSRGSITVDDNLYVGTEGKSLFYSESANEFRFDDDVSTSGNNLKVNGDAGAIWVGEGDGNISIRFYNETGTDIVNWKKLTYDSSKDALCSSVGVIASRDLWVGDGSSAGAVPRDFKITFDCANDDGILSFIDNGAGNDGNFKFDKDVYVNTREVIRYSLLLS